MQWTDGRVRRYIRMHEGGVSVPGCACWCVRMLFIKNAYIHHAPSSIEKDLFKQSKVKVIGISADPVGKQKEFVEKQKLTVRMFRFLHFSYVCNSAELTVISRIVSSIERCEG